MTSLPFHLASLAVRCAHALMPTIMPIHLESWGGEPWSFYNKKHHCVTRLAPARCAADCHSGVLEVILLLIIDFTLPLGAAEQAQVTLLYLSSKECTDTDVPNCVPVRTVYRTYNLSSHTKMQSIFAVKKSPS